MASNITVPPATPAPATTNTTVRSRTYLVMRRTDARSRNKALAKQAEDLTVQINKLVDDKNRIAKAIQNNDDEILDLDLAIQVLGRDAANRFDALTPVTEEGNVRTNHSIINTSVDTEEIAPFVPHGGNPSDSKPDPFN